VANSANRLCGDGGAGAPLIGREAERPGSEETDADGVWPGAGDGDGDPNNRRVEEKRREGNRLVDEYYRKSFMRNRMRADRNLTYRFIPLNHALFHPWNKAHYDELARETRCRLDVRLQHLQRI
jgi:hypothetical protein